MEDKKIQKLTEEEWLASEGGENAVVGNDVGSRFSILSNLQPYSFTFFLNGNMTEPIIVINEEGFRYKGELIEDNGEIYKLFKKYLKMETEIKFEEISQEQLEEERNPNYKYFDIDEISDEEIENEATHYKEANGSYSFKMAIKWYREQLKSRQ